MADVVPVIRCVNCSLKLNRLRKRLLENESPVIKEIIKEWINPKEITDGDYICIECWQLASQKLRSRTDPTSTSETISSATPFGHRRVCVACGRSVLRRKRRLVLRFNNTDLDEACVEHIAGRIAPRQLTPTDEVCTACWLRSERIAKKKHKVWLKSRPTEWLRGDTHQEPEQDSKPARDLHKEPADPLHETHCVNCHIKLTHDIRRHHLRNENHAVRQIINHWLYPEALVASDEVCVPCWLTAQNIVEERAQANATNSDDDIKEEAIDEDCKPSPGVLANHVNAVASNVNHSTEATEDVSNFSSHQAYDVDQESSTDCEIDDSESLQVISIDDDEQEPQIDQQEPHSGEENTDNVELELHTEKETSIVQQKRHYYQKLRNDRQDPDYVQQKSHNGQQDAQQMSKVQQKPHKETITLPNIKRAPETARKCLFYKCTGRERIFIPNLIRHQVIRDFKFYIPKHTRICLKHLRANDYDKLYNAPNTLNVFTQVHIEDMVFISNLSGNVNFENIEAMEDHLVEYWVGVTKQQFKDILIETPRLNTMRKGSVALAALLCKMKTRDSGGRLSSLFQMPRRTLETMMARARELLKEDYVPRHPGVFNSLVTKMC